LSAPPLSILCVDDQELPLKLRQLVLEKQGYRVITANSASSAMELIAKHHIDLVLTDQLMPGGTGIELAKSVKQIHPDLPVVLISGVNEVPPDADAADLFISKIEGPAIMCEKISQVLAGHRPGHDAGAAMRPNGHK
jgi:DNA-binding NtrC family response regulator